MAKGISEKLIVDRTRSAVSKLDRQGFRGTEKVTFQEIEALVLFAILMGGPLITSAANHKPEKTQ